MPATAADTAAMIETVSPVLTAKLIRYGEMMMKKRPVRVKCMVLLRVCVCVDSGYDSIPISDTVNP